VRPETLGPSTQPWTRAGYEEKTVQSGHWLMLEKPDEVSRILIEFADPN
jgi:pimeloyl-ACP methyl ester carboxylesterase